MELTKRQIQTYNRNGYLFIRNLFSSAELKPVLNELTRVLSKDAPVEGKVLEKGSDTVRTVYGSHASSDIMHRLVRHPRIVGPATQLLGSPVYIHQFKINIKAAFRGDVWQWHQDYIYWLREDGMLQPKATTAAVFLDEVNEFNGPLMLIPRSQRFGVIDTPPRETAPAWLASVIADLKYRLEQDRVAALVAEEKIVAPKGPTGSVLFFHCNIVHGSVPNMSPFDRRIAYVTFNSVQNHLVPLANERPSFMANRDFTPVVAAEDDCFAPQNVAVAST
jgi:ectoine hydroxylase